MIKFSVNKSELLTPLLNTAKAASTRSVIGALEGILFKLTSDRLTLVGYDLELGIKSEIAVEGKSDGEILLSSKLICEIIRKMPDGKIEFEETERLKISLRCDNVEYSIIGIDSEEYPLIPEITRGEKFEIGESVLKSMISQTIYAVAVIDTKPVLMGTKFDIVNNELNLVSTDSIRIAVRKEKLVHEDFDFIVPSKTLNEIQRLLSDDESKTALVCVDRNQCIFKLDKYTVFSRLLDGDFFDYTKMSSLKPDTEVQVDVRPLIECIDRTLLLINDKFRAPVDLIFSDNTLRIYCETAIGKLDQQIPADYTGSGFTISFNSRYLLDALRNTCCDRVRFDFITEKMQALKISPLEGDSFMFAVSPVRRRV